MNSIRHIFLRALVLGTILIPQAYGKPAAVVQKLQSHTSEFKIRGTEIVSSGFPGTKSDQKKSLNAALSGFSKAYFKVEIERMPEIVTTTKDPGVADVKVFFRVSIDTASIPPFLKNMSDIDYGESYETFRIGGEDYKFKMFEQNRLWMVNRYQFLYNKRLLKLVSGNEVLLSQTITFIVNTYWEDLENPRISWVAKLPGYFNQDVYDSFVPTFREQGENHPNGEESFFVFREVPLSKIKEVTSVKIVDVE